MSTTPKTYEQDGRTRFVDANSKGWEAVSEGRHVDTGRGTITAWIARGIPSGFDGTWPNWAEWAVFYRVHRTGRDASVVHVKVEDEAEARAKIDQEFSKYPSNTNAK